MIVTMTGATGFIGKAVALDLLEAGHQVNCIGRRVSGIPGATDYTSQNPTQLPGSKFPSGDVFIHLAALSEASRGTSRQRTMETNVDWPVECLKAAEGVGYSHFLFMSTAKVFGDYSDDALESTTALNPMGLYAESKAMAESKLEALSADIAVTILRPPAVYGLPPKGGFANLVKALNSSKLLPLSTGVNQRSFLSLNNLVSATAACLGKVDSGVSHYLVHDHEIISTNSFIEQIAKSLAVEPKTIRLPSSLMRIADGSAKLLIKKEPFAALHRNFYTRCTEFSDQFEWTPQHNTSNSLKQMLESYHD